MRERCKYPRTLAESWSKIKDLQEKLKIAREALEGLLNADGGDLLGYHLEDDEYEHDKGYIEMAEAVKKAQQALKEISEDGHGEG